MEEETPKDVGTWEEESSPKEERPEERAEEEIVQEKVEEREEEEAGEEAADEEKDEEEGGEDEDSGTESQDEVSDAVSIEGDAVSSAVVKALARGIITDKETPSYATKDAFVWKDDKEQSWNARKLEAGQEDIRVVTMENEREMEFDMKGWAEAARMEIPFAHPAQKTAEKEATFVAQILYPKYSVSMDQPKMELNPELITAAKEIIGAKPAWLKKEMIENACKTLENVEHEKVRSLEFAAIKDGESARWIDISDGGEPFDDMLKHMQNGGDVNYVIGKRPEIMEEEPPKEEEKVEPKEEEPPKEEEEAEPKEEEPRKDEAKSEEKETGPPLEEKQEPSEEKQEPSEEPEKKKGMQFFSRGKDKAKKVTKGVQETAKKTTKDVHEKTLKSVPRGKKKVEEVHSFSLVEVVQFNELEELFHEWGQVIPQTVTLGGMGQFSQEKMAKGGWRERSKREKVKKRLEKRAHDFLEREKKPKPEKIPEKFRGGETHELGSGYTTWVKSLDETKYLEVIDCKTFTPLTEWFPGEMKGKVNDILNHLKPITASLKPLQAEEEGKVTPVAS